MARPGLTKNIKFKVLMTRLGLPRPYVLGLLETLWEWAHECGSPMLGDALAVECAAEWPGERNELFEALRDGHWIDETDDGRWRIHDYLDHAPEYVSNRASRESERKKTKSCDGCGNDFRSSDARAKYCSSACRTAAWRERQCPASDGERRSETNIVTQVTGCDTTPNSRSQLPLPTPQKENARARVSDSRAERPAEAPTIAADLAARGIGDSAYAAWGERVATLLGWQTAKQKRLIGEWYATLQTVKATAAELDAVYAALAARTEPLKWPNEVLPAIQLAIKKVRDEGARAARRAAAGKPRDGPVEPRLTPEETRAKVREAKARLGRAG